jgi:hypothetical protein
MTLKLFYLTLVALVALVFWSDTSRADVTGSFGIRIALDPFACQDVPIFQTPSMQLGDQPCEKTVFKIDFQTELNINIAISGLILGIHSHTGVTGLEDIILYFTATLGDLDITDTFVFAQPFGVVEAADGEFIPTCYESEPGSGVCQTLFVKKRVETTISLGGVTFENLAMIEDVKFPDPGLIKPQKAIYTTQSQSFGFGDVVTLKGQMPSGITIRSETGICAEQKSNRIKKHSWSFTVNPDCVSGIQTPSAKPPLFFDFERLWIENIPLAPGLTKDIHIECTGVLACEFESTFTFTGAAIFPVIEASFEFANLFGPIAFEGVRMTLLAGRLTLTLTFDELLEPTSLSVTAAFTFNPDANPARLSVFVSATPGTGITSLVVALSVRRAGLAFLAISSFTGSDASVDFSQLTLRATAEAGMVDLEANVVFTASELVGISTEAEVNF